MTRRIWTGRLLFVLAWVAIALVFSSQLRLLAVLSGMPMTWGNIVTWELTRWCLWIVLFPLILYAIRKTTGYSKVRFLITNSVVSILISLLHLAIFSLVYWFIIRLTEAYSPESSLFEILFTKLPAAIRKANFDPHRLFQTIFSIDFHIGLILYWIILAWNQALNYSRHAAELKTQLVGAQLQALKMQLHPHFLFNTLNSISALIQKDPDAADEMIGELGNFLRLTLKNNSAPEVTLEEELRFLSSYLEIERIRFHNKLELKLSIDPNSLQVLVPNLILQPIIENAIRHGIAHLTESGQIELLSQRNGNHLKLQIQDNGPGLPETYREGIGITNVRERLARLYGADYEFEISNRDGAGVRVNLRIPARLSLVADESV